MKKYTTAFAITVTALSFASMTWADDTGIEAEGDSLHGHGAVPASKSDPYVAANDRAGQVGTDVINYPQDFKKGSPGQSGVGSDHQDHEDTLHAIVKH